MKHWYLIYTENFAHCFTCRGKVLAELLAFVAGMASWLELKPQRVIRVEYDREIECDPYTEARYFAKHGYYGMGGQD